MSLAFKRSKTTFSSIRILATVARQGDDGRLQIMMTSLCEGNKMSIVVRFLKDLTVHCYLSSRCLLELQYCVKNINGKVKYCSVLSACRA